VGITDQNFAETVYETIAKMILSGTYDVSGYNETKEVLENFKNDNLSGTNYAVIDASRKGIKSIEGIRLLKNAYEIELEKNLIHDLTPLAYDGIVPEDLLYFNKTNIRIDGGNFQNVIPAELIGTQDGNITVDSTQEFKPAVLSFLRTEMPKAFYLDFGLKLHGEEGGIFNEEYSALGSYNNTDAVWTSYADYQARSTGTEITGLSEEGTFRITANAQGDYAHGLSPTVHYYSSAATDRTLNLQWSYPFRAVFWNVFTEHADIRIYGGIVLKKTDTAGNPLAGAEYELYRIEESGERTRCPDERTVFTSDANGEVIIHELPEGRYELKETKAPEGYEISSFPVEATVSFPENLPFTEAVSGGEQSVTFTPDNAVFGPDWDGNYDPQIRQYTHAVKLMSGEPVVKNASDYAADCFIRNGGAGISVLKGEPAGTLGITADTVKTEILLENEESVIGTYSDAEEAKNAVNAILQSGGLRRKKDNLTMTAHMVYHADVSTYAHVTQENRLKTPHPVSVSGQECIRVLKKWNSEEHPDHALFCLVKILPDGSRMRIGEIKRADENSAWKAEWTFTETATLSDASSSDATLSDALLYDEDGSLINGVVREDFSQQICAEEVSVPSGWEVSYAEPEEITENNTVIMLYEIINRKIPGEPTLPPAPPAPTPPAPTPPAPTPPSPTPPAPAPPAPTPPSPTPPTPAPPTPTSPSLPTPGGEETPLPAPVVPLIGELPEPGMPFTVLYGEKLPWGRITRQGMPLTGEKNSLKDFCLFAAFLWTGFFTLLTAGKFIRHRNSDRTRRKKHV